MLYSEDSTPGTTSPPSWPSTPETEREVLFEDSLFHDTSEQSWLLITGGLGFIGSHATLELLKAGRNVVIVDDLSNSYSHVLDRLLKAADLHFAASNQIRPKADFHQLNYHDSPGMSKMLDTYRSPHPITGSYQTTITGVIHFASLKAVEESIRYPLTYYRHNLNGLVDFLHLLDTYNIKNFVFSSSAAVYGSLADQHAVVREEHVTHETEFYEDPLTGETVRCQAGSVGITNPYGRTKYFGEAILSDLARSGCGWNIICLRYFNPIGCDRSGLLGEDPRGTPSNLVPIITKVLMGEWKELQVFGVDWDTTDGSAIRDFIHVSDLARGHIAAVEATQQRASFCGENGMFRVINLGTGSGHSVLEVVSAMEKASGSNVPLRFCGRRAGDVRSSVAATERAGTELGWRPRETLLGACRDLWRYLTVGEGKGAAGGLEAHSEAD